MTTQPTEAQRTVLHNASMGWLKSCCIDDSIVACVDAGWVVRDTTGVDPIYRLTPAGREVLEKEQ
jgi:DNA-binding PadR family transcriptional regulator